VTLPFDLRQELQKLRALELAALKADNAVLRQRLKIFPPLEAEIKALTESSSLKEMSDKFIARTIDQHGGNKLKAAAALGIGRSTIYKRLRSLNGVTA
jgi:transcriptional regulator of acetoin/glycerol metabolism